MSESLSAGLKSIPNRISSFASTQAAWRFYGNDSVTLKKLQSPLTEAAHAGIETLCDRYTLCAHDWCRLSYKHANKADTYAITHATDVGYDLQSSLLLSDREGHPIAPSAQCLVSAQGSYATYHDTTEARPAKTHLDELTDCIRHLEQQGFEKPLVHIIDREGDSVGHIRQWESLESHWLVRVKDNPHVDYKGKSMACKMIASQLDYTRSGTVNYHGAEVEQWTSEAEVILSRPAKPSQKKVKKPEVPGAPVTARLVATRLLSDQGELLAQWLLLTNVHDVDTATVALWYYWRWRIESYFKLLKSAGHHLESWQQESALAIFRRLLVVGMACVTVWAIAHDEHEETVELRHFLVKLSGRQVPQKKAFTYPALLAGLGQFLSMLIVMENYSAEEINQFKSTAQRIWGT